MTCVSFVRIGQETLMEENIPDDEIEIELAPIAVQLAYVKQVIVIVNDSTKLRLKKKKKKIPLCCLGIIIVSRKFLIAFTLLSWGNSININLFYIFLFLYILTASWAYTRDHCSLHRNNKTRSGR